MEDLKLNNLNDRPGENLQVKEMNVFQRMIGVIVSPTETMRSIASKPKVLIPLIVAAIIPTLLILLRFSQYQEFSRQIMELSMANSNAQLTPEQVDQSIKMFSTYGVVFAPIQMLIVWIIGTALFFGLTKLFKGEGSFKQFMSITAYSYMIVILGSIIQTLVSFFTGNYIMDTSLANITNIFAPDMKGSYVYGIIRSIELFAIWQFVVLGIGTAAVSKLSKTKVVIITALLCLVSVLYTAMGYKFM